MINVFEKISDLVWAINSSIFGVAVLALIIGFIVSIVKDYKNAKN